MSLATFAEELAGIRHRLTALRAEEGELKSRETALTNDILSAMKEASMDAAETGGLKFRVGSEVVGKPDPEHWQDIFNWIAENDHWHLVRKQLNSTGIKEMATAGLAIPFVEVIELDKLKVTG
jgi:hypothetical protein